MARVNSHLRSFSTHRSRKPLLRSWGVELLEDRTLLATDFSALAIDPSAYDASRILVRFRPDVDGSQVFSRSLLQSPVLNASPVGLVSGLYEIQLPSNVSVADSLAAYRANPLVMYAEPDYRVHLDLTPNDPQYSNLWGLNNTGQTGGTPDVDIDAPEAWDITTGDPNTIVAVIDTGVEWTHPDLAANIWTNPGETPGDGIDNDGNGFIDDIHGYDFVNNDGDPRDDHGHGTHVAGTIGAVGNNSIGVTGINWHVQIMGLKFLDAQGGGEISDAVRALNYAVQMGAHVSNNSYTGGGYSQAFFDALAAAQNAGHIFVAAAGNATNNNDANPEYPTNYELDNIVSVAAVDHNDHIASFSNYGATTVDLAAPGVDITSTWINGGYNTISGTSMASPHVAGVMALVRGQHPEWTYRQVIDQVLNTVDAVPALGSKTITGGRLNAAGAVGVPDSVGPRVVAASPIGTTSIGTLRVTFSEPMDTATFTLADIVSFSGPSGPLMVSGVTPVAGSGDRKFDITFPNQSERGGYTLAFGPAITDLAGNAMNQNGNGVNGETPGDRYSAIFTIADSYEFHSTDVPKSFFFLTTAESTLTIDQDILVGDINVRLNIEHESVGELRLTLVSPNGTNIQLAQFRGLGANFENTVFDDEADTAIGEGSAPFAGSYRPEQPLSVLDELSSAGTWTLQVENWGFELGTLDAWSLIVTPDVSPPRAAIGDVRVAEGNNGTSEAQFTVTLSKPYELPVAIAFDTADGTATAGSDYQAVSGTLNFAPGETTKTISVPILGDLLDESDETFVVNLSNPLNATLIDDQAVGTIANDEAVLTVNDVSVLEGDSGTRTLVFTVGLLATSGQTVSVSYVTADGTATSGSDYVATSGVVSFAPGETSKTVSVTVTGDSRHEPDETVLLNLSTPVNAVVGDGVGLGTILNDDPLPGIAVADVKITEGQSGTKTFNFNVSLTSPSGQTVTVQYATSNGTATAGSDYVAASGILSFSPGQTFKSITITVNGDVTAEVDETFYFTLSNPSNARLFDGQAMAVLQNDDTTVAIADVSVTEGDSGVFNTDFVISLSAPVAFPVSVNYATQNNAASSGNDYVATSGVLTIPAGATSGTITIFGLADTRNEVAEGFYVNLTNAANSVLGDAQAVGTIIDDDPEPDISVSDVTVVEGNAGTRTVSFAVSISSASGRTVTVDYATQNGTATAGSDYIAKSGTLSFIPGVASTSVSVTINSDMTPEIDEDFFLQLSNPTNGFVLDGLGTAVIQEDDALTISDATIVEGNDGTNNALFTVSLGVAQTAVVTVNYTTVNGTASSGSDYIPVSGVLTFAPGETTKAVLVPVVGDPGNEADETFSVSLSNAAGTILADAQGTGTIVDDDALPRLVISDLAVAEGNSGTKSLTATVTLLGMSNRTVSVNYATVDGTAAAGSDYVTKTGTLSFGAGTTSQIIFLSVNGDTSVEADESFFVQLSNPNGTTLEDDQGTVLIANDDSAPVMTVTDVKTTEGNSGTKLMGFTVNLSAASSQTVTVNYATGGGTATGGSDYTAASGTLTFLPGQTLKTVNVTLTGDAAAEPDETFFVTLSNAINATVLDGEGLGTIQNDDASLRINDLTLTEGDGFTFDAAFTASLLAPVPFDVTASWATAASTATAGSDFVSGRGTLVIPAGQLSTTVSVLGLADTRNEASETFAANLSNSVNAVIADNQGVATILDDDALPSLTISDAAVVEGTGGTHSLNFTVSLSAPSGRTVTVNYATANGTATGSDYTTKTGTLSFLFGGTSQTISVPITTDTLPEADETFFVNLSAASGALIADGQAVGTITDDDNLRISDATTVEGDDGTRSAVFTVSLTVPSPVDVTVTYTTVNSSATAGVDYVAVSGTVTLPAGQASQQIVVPVLGDRGNEEDETFYLNLSNAVNGVLADAQGIGTISNDDTLPAVSISGVQVMEGNSGTRNAVFTVSLSAPSGRTVTVYYATADGTALAGSDYVAKSGSLLFGPGSTSQTISVTINGDLAIESDETFLVNLTSATNATIAGGSGTGSILNDEGGGGAAGAGGGSRRSAKKPARAHDLRPLHSKLDRAASDAFGEALAFGLLEFARRRPR